MDKVPTHANPTSTAAEQLLAQCADEPLARIIAQWRARRPDPAASVNQRRHARQAITDDLPPGPPMAKVRPIQIPATDKHPGMRARLYCPTESDAPLMVYLHGGGWVTGGLDSHERTCRKLAQATAHHVLALQYRLAPENPWPGALEDSIGGVSWAMKHRHILGSSNAAVGIVGDSSGGHLAGLTCIHLRLRGLPLPAWQALAYPNIDPTAQWAFNSASQDKADGWVLRSVDVAWFCQQAFPAEGAQKANLLAHTLTGLPPSVIVTCEHDPLRSEGNAYAHALHQAGVRVLHREEPRMIHGFLLGHEVHSPAAAQAGQRFFHDITTISQQGSPLQPNPGLTGETNDV